MKFGKKFKVAQEAGWIYLDYKGLKNTLKSLRKCPTRSPENRAAEHGFQEDLWNEIAQVNAFFLRRERELSAMERGKDQTFRQLVCALRSFAVLNYLAVLKITKKHDKHSDLPLREMVVEHLFSQSFCMALEHSYLFDEVAIAGGVDAAQTALMGSSHGSSLTHEGEGAGEAGSSDSDDEAAAPQHKLLNRMHGLVASALSPDASVSSPSASSPRTPSEGGKGSGFARGPAQREGNVGVEIERLLGRAGVEKYHPEAQRIGGEEHDLNDSDSSSGTKPGASPRPTGGKAESRSAEGRNAEGRSKRIGISPRTDASAGAAMRGATADGPSTPPLPGGLVGPELSFGPEPPAEWAARSVPHVSPRYEPSAAPAPAIVSPRATRACALVPATLHFVEVEAQDGIFGLDM